MRRILSKSRQCEAHDAGRRTLASSCWLAPTPPLHSKLVPKVWTGMPDYSRDSLEQEGEKQQAKGKGNPDQHTATARKARLPPPDYDDDGEFCTTKMPQEQQRQLNTMTAAKS